MGTDNSSVDSEIERLTLEFRLSSQQAEALRDDREQLRSALKRIVSYSLLEDSKAMEWVRNAARGALSGKPIRPEQESR